MGDKNQKKKAKAKKTGAFETQAISQADSRQNKTGMAMPNGDNTGRNKNWVDQNQK